jgi:hypothetical protein
MARVFSETVSRLSISSRKAAWHLERRMVPEGDDLESFSAVEAALDEKMDGEPWPPNSTMDLRRVA